MGHNVSVRLMAADAAYTWLQARNRQIPPKSRFGLYNIIVTMNMTYPGGWEAWVERYESENHSHEPREHSDHR